MNLGRFCGAETALLACLTVVVEILRKRLGGAKSVCVKRRHGDVSAWALSAGEVLQEELAAACFC